MIAFNASSPSMRRSPMSSQPVFHVRPLSGSHPSQTERGASWSALASSRSIIHQWRGPSKGAVAESTRGLSVLVEAHMPLAEALRATAAQCTDAPLKRTLRAVCRGVESGRSLSSCLADHPKTFRPLYVHLVEVGEAVGRLAPVLRRMADYLERTEELRRSVRLALIYPGLIVAVAVGAIGFMLTVIVPTFAEMFEGFGAELPAATRRVIAASGFLTDHALGAMGAFIAGAAVVRYALRSDAGRRLWDRWTLRLPLIGRMLQKGLGARFCRTLGTLIEHDVPLTRALHLLFRSLENVVARDELVRMTRAVERGGSLSHPLTHSEAFPPLVGQMILVGEKTARLDETLLHVADVYENELDHHVDALTSVIEPILILVLGIILGAILIALYLPLFDLVTVVP